MHAAARGGEVASCRRPAGRRPARQSDGPPTTARILGTGLKLSHIKTYRAHLDRGSGGQQSEIALPPCEHSNWPLRYCEERRRSIQCRTRQPEVHRDSPAIRPPPYCTEFGNGDFWFLAPGPRTQYVVVLRNGPLRGRCYYLTGLYLLFICPTCLIIALKPRSTQVLSLLALSGTRLCSPSLSELRYGPWGVALLVLHLLHLLLVLAAGEENSSLCHQHKHTCWCCCLVLPPAAFAACCCRCCLAFLVVLLWLLQPSCFF